MIIKKKLKKLMQKDRYEIHVKKLTKKTVCNQPAWCFGLLWNPSNPLALLGFMAEAPHNIHECLQLPDLRDNLSINMPLESHEMYLLQHHPLNHPVHCARVEGEFEGKGEERTRCQGNKDKARPINKQWGRSQKEFKVLCYFTGEWIWRFRGL